MSKIKSNCKNCGEVVERYPSQMLATVYCSRKCRSEYMQKNNTVTFNCYHCKKSSKTRKSAYSEEKRNFCTRICKDEWQRNGLKGSANPFYNKKHTKETKIKVSVTKKSADLTGEKAHNFNTHPVNCAQCGKVTHKIGYLIQRSENLFCSVSCHGAWRTEHSTGENNPNWNYELTEEERVRNRKYPEYYDFLSDVMRRDNYTCDICGYYGKWGSGMNVHHLNSHDWDKSNRTNPENGITLCKPCHVSFHKIYGYGKNTKEQYYEYKTIEVVKEGV